MHWLFSCLYQPLQHYWHRLRRSRFNRWLSSLFVLVLSFVIVIYGTGTPHLFAATPDLLQQAQLLNRQGQQALTAGQPQTALDYWQEAEIFYQQAQDDMGVWGSQLNQAKALQTLGFYRRADTILSQLSETVASQPPSLLAINVCLTYGHGLRLLGYLESSQTSLEQGLAMATTLHDSSHQQAAHLYLGNTFFAQQQWLTATEHYHQALTLPGPLQLTARLRDLQVLPHINPEADVRAQSQAFVNRLSHRPLEQTQIYLALDFAHWLLQTAPETFAQLTPNPDDLIHMAIQQADDLGDRRAQSYGWGYLGQWYEYQQQWSNAEHDTQQALQLAQGLNANELLYQWEWQQGRIARAQGAVDEAIVHYTATVDILQLLRQEIVAITRDVQFSFRDQIEPIYRDLVQLLLSPAILELQPQTYLEQARQVIEKLQVSELNNFFREPCIEAIPGNLDTVDPTAAVLYPIILPDRLVVILSIPNQELFYYSLDRPQTVIEEGVQNMLNSMRLTAFPKERLTAAQQLYEWLIQPAESILETNNIQTLTFVLDGALRNLPVAALYNGTHYLVEDYQLAISPGLQLLQVNDDQVNFSKPRALVGGLISAGGDRHPLVGVRQEIEHIKQLMNSQVLLDEQFTNRSLFDQSERRTFDIVHLATHAQFGETDADTFIETWNGTLQINQLRQLLRQQDIRGLPPALLVLSACDTAQGNNRAVLGMAGLAVRSGAQSTLATLWSVNDQATAMFIRLFYDGLITEGLTKAGAIRYAQKTLIETKSFQHPYYWAPFVLVGNWL